MRRLVNRDIVDMGVRYGMRLWSDFLDGGHESRHEEVGVSVPPV